MQPGECICDAIPSIPTRTRIVVIRHCKEALRSTNSVRVAALALPRCEVYDYGRRDEPLDADALDLAGARLLFPDRPGPPLDPEAPPRTLVVVDGSWSQARRIAHRVPALIGMPRLGLPPPSRPPVRLREQPHPDGMATMEAIARALELLEGPAVSAPLDALYRTLVRAVRTSKGLEPRDH